MVELFNKTMDIPTRTYEVYGFDAFKFKVRACRFPSLPSLLALVWCWSTRAMGSTHTRTHTHTTPPLHPNTQPHAHDDR